MEKPIVQGKDEPILNPKLSTRLTSLDVFRGIAIAGMILVNQASLGESYSFLDHADWNGWTFADLVFPSFLFIVGVAMAFSFAKYLEKQEAQTSQEADLSPLTPPYGKPLARLHSSPLTHLYWHILRRSLILFVIGLLLNGFWRYDWSTIRIMGVLQRISLAYLLASFVVLKLPRKGQWAFAAILLVGYWLAMSFIPVPDYGAGVLTREGNLGAYIDRLIIGTAHLYRGDNYHGMGDPEGLLSTLPAVVSVLLGYFTGQWLRQRPILSQTSMDLVLFGLSSLVISGLWNAAFPINKKLWTSSYVLFAAGLALLVLGACYELIEVRKLRRWGKPFEVMGLNAIFLFIASVLVIKILVTLPLTFIENSPTLFTWIYETIFVSWAGKMNGSLVFALLTLIFWWAVAYRMYRRRWFFKI